MARNREEFGKLTGKQMQSLRVDESNLADNSVTGRKIARQAVDNLKLANAAVSAEKLAEDVRRRLVPTEDYVAALHNERGARPTGNNPYITWDDFLKARSSWQDPVRTRENLPAVNNLAYDVRLVADERALYAWFPRPVRRWVKLYDFNGVIMETIYSAAVGNMAELVLEHGRDANMSRVVQADIYRKDGVVEVTRKTAIVTDNEGELTEAWDPSSVYTVQQAIAKRTSEDVIPGNADARYWRSIGALYDPNLSTHAVYFGGQAYSLSGIAVRRGTGRVMVLDGNPLIDYEGQIRVSAADVVNNQIRLFDNSVPSDPTRIYSAAPSKMRLVTDQRGRSHVFYIDADDGLLYYRHNMVDSDDRSFFAEPKPVRQEQVHDFALSFRRDFSLNEYDTARSDFPAGAEYDEVYTDALAQGGWVQLAIIIDEPGVVATDPPKRIEFYEGRPQGSLLPIGPWTNWNSAVAAGDWELVGQAEGLPESIDMCSTPFGPPEIVDQDINRTPAIIGITEENQAIGQISSESAEGLVRCFVKTSWSANSWAEAVASDDSPIFRDPGTGALARGTGIRVGFEAGGDIEKGIRVLYRRFDGALILWRGGYGVQEGQQVSFDKRWALVGSVFNFPVPRGSSYDLVIKPWRMRVWTSHELNDNIEPGNMICLNPDGEQRSFHRVRSIFNNPGNIFAEPGSAPNVDQNPLFNSGKFPLDSANSRSLTQLSTVGVGLPQAWRTHPALGVAGSGTVDNRYHPLAGDMVSDIVYDPQAPAPSGYTQYVYGINSKVLPQYDWENPSEAPGTAGHLGNVNPELNLATPTEFAPNYIEIDGGSVNMKNFRIWHRVPKTQRGTTVVINSENYVAYNDESVLVDRGVPIRFRIVRGDPIKSTVVDYDVNGTANDPDANPLFCYLPALQNYQQYVTGPEEVATQFALMPLTEGLPISWGTYDWDHLVSDGQVNIVEGETVVYAIDDSDYQRIKRRTYGTSLVENRSWLSFNGLVFPGGVEEVNAWSELSDEELNYHAGSPTPNPAEAAAYRSMVYNGSYNQTTESFTWIDASSEGEFMGYRALWMRAVMNDVTGEAHLLFADAEDNGRPKYINTENGNSSFGRAILVNDEPGGEVPGDLSLDYRERPSFLCYAESGLSRGSNHIDLPWPIRMPWLRQTGAIFENSSLSPRYGAAWIPLPPHPSEPWFQASYQHSNAAWESMVRTSRDQREEKSRYAYEASGLIHGGITEDGRLSNQLFFFNIFTGPVEITPGNSPYRAFHCGAVDNRGFLWLYGGGGDRSDGNSQTGVAPDARNVPELPEEEQTLLYYCKITPWSADESASSTTFYNTAFTTNDITTGVRPFTGFRSLRLSDESNAPRNVLCGKMFFLSTQIGQSPGDDITPYDTFGEYKSSYAGWELAGGDTAQVLSGNPIAVAAATETAPSLSPSDPVARDRMFINTAAFQASGPWAGQLKNSLCFWDGTEWTFRTPADGEIIFYRRATDLAAAGYTVESFIRSVALDTGWPGAITPIPSAYAGTAITDTSDDGFYQYSSADDKWLRLSYFDTGTQEWTRVNGGVSITLDTAPPPVGHPSFQDYATWAETGGRDIPIVQNLYIFNPNDTGSKMYRVVFEPSSLRLHPEYPGDSSALDDRNGMAWDVFDENGGWVERYETGWLPSPNETLVNDFTMNSVFTDGAWEIVSADGTTPPDGLVAPATDWDPYDERMYVFGGVVPSGESREFLSAIYELSYEQRQTITIGAITTISVPAILQWSQADTLTSDTPTGRCGSMVAKTTSGLYVFGGKVGANDEDYEGDLSDETWYFAFEDSTNGAVSGGRWYNWSSDGQRPPRSCYLTGGSLPYGAEPAGMSDGMFVCLGKTIGSRSFVDSYRFGPSEGMINAWGRKGHFVDRANHGEVTFQSEGVLWDGTNYRPSDFSRFGVFQQGPSVDDHDKKCFFTVRITLVAPTAEVPPYLPFGAVSPWNNPEFADTDVDKDYFSLLGSESPASQIDIPEPFWERDGQVLSDLLTVEHPVLRATEDDRFNEIVIHEMTPYDSILSNAFEPLQPDAFGGIGYGWGAAGPALDPDNFPPLPRHRIGTVGIQIMRYWEGKDPETGRVMASKTFSDCTVGRRQPRHFSEAIGGAYSNWSRSWVYQNDIGAFASGNWGSMGDPFNRYTPDDPILSAYPIFLLYDDAGEPLYGMPAGSTQISTLVSYDDGKSWRAYSTSNGGWISVDPRDSHTAGMPLPGLPEDVHGFGQGTAESLGITQIGLPAGDVPSIDRISYDQWNLTTGAAANRGFRGGDINTLRFLFSLNAYHWPRWTPFVKSVRVRHTGGGYWEPVYDPNNGIQIKKTSPTKTVGMNTSGESQKMRLTVIYRPN